MQSYTQMGRPLLPRNEVEHPQVLNTNTLAGTTNPLPTACLVPNRNRNARISRAQWEQIKPFFNQHYVDEDRTLDDTMQLLYDEQGFSATYVLHERSEACLIGPK